MVQQTKESKDFESSQVPLSKRKGFLSLFVIMLGFTFFSASMSVGARLGNSLSFSGFLTAILIGSVILGAYTGLLAYVGSSTGLSMDLLAHYSFGKKGSYLPSAMIALTQVGWFGVGVAMLAYPLSELFGISPIIFVVIAGILMTVSAWFGIDALTIVSSISVPLISILGIISMYMAITQSGGLSSMFGTDHMPMLTAVGLVVGSFVSGGTTTPNFVRFAKNKGIAVTTTVIAFFAGNCLMFLFGAIGGAYTNSEDIFYVMIAQGLTIPAILVLGANIWTTNDNALYSAGLGLSNITSQSKKITTLVGGILGTVAALWLYDNFVGWLNLLNTTLPPVGIILILDYFCRKKDYESEEPQKDFRIFSILGVIAGAIGANFIPIGISSINAMVIAAISYFIGALLDRRKEQIPGSAWEMPGESN